MTFLSPKFFMNGSFYVLEYIFIPQYSVLREDIVLIRHFLFINDFKSLFFFCFSSQYFNTNYVSSSFILRLKTTNFLGVSSSGTLLGVLQHPNPLLLSLTCLRHVFFTLQKTNVPKYFLYYLLKVIHLHCKSYKFGPLV